MFCCSLLIEFARYFGTLSGRWLDLWVGSKWICSSRAVYELLLLLWSDPAGRKSNNFVPANGLSSIRMQVSFPPLGSKTVKNGLWCDLVLHFSIFPYIDVSHEIFLLGKRSCGYNSVSAFFLFEVKASVKRQCIDKLRTGKKQTFSNNNRRNRLKPIFIGSFQNPSPHKSNLSFKHTVNIW